MNPLIFQKYEVELYTRQGVLAADISHLVKSLSFSMTRSDAEQLSLSIDLNAYEDMCAILGTHPTAILGAYQTDIKVKRAGQYLFGTHVGYITSALDENEETIEARAFGYLNLLIDRYVTKTYTAQDSVDVNWDLINETQSQDNGDMGIVLGPEQTVSTPIDREYVRQNVKEAVIGNAILNGYDVEIDHDKNFNTYAMKGTDQSATLRFTYPGNIKSVEIPRDGLPLYNKIYGLGSGFGEEVIESTQRDETSELNYGVHEKISTFNSIKDATELDENVLSELGLRKNILEIPQMVVSGEDFDLNDYGVGDRVYVKIENHPFLATIDGVYRIERIDVSIDENEAEEIRLYFDNYGLDV